MASRTVRLTAGLLLEDRISGNSEAPAVAKVPGKRKIPVVQHVASTDGQDKYGSSGIAASHGMDELDLRNRIEEQRAKAGHLHAHGFKVEPGTNGILHLKPAGLAPL